ncbi:MAG: response regulator transcription factor [Chloroflexi bacterium]|nr:response regulator transcription factor [Chloroflexota bacterium]
MLKVLVVADGGRELPGIVSGLAREGLICAIVGTPSEAMEQVTQESPNVVLVHLNGHRPGSPVYELPWKIKEERRVPVIALISRQALGNIDFRCGIDDFVVEPWNAEEVAVRVKRALRLGDESPESALIKCGDLVIDPETCEVSLGGGPVDLTFREYELLRFLATNRGRVFTREALLDRVWGYDYYGGDRTVDVHVRRLRGKIEDASHTYIETVRNVGYKFRKEMQVNVSFRRGTTLRHNLHPASNNTRSTWAKSAGNNASVH